MNSQRHPRKRRMWNDPEVVDLIVGYLEDLDTPRSLAVALCYKHGAHAELLSLPAVQESPLTGADRFSRDYAASRLLSKADFLQTGIDKKAVALEQERLAEDRCRETNLFLKTDSLERNYFLTSAAVERARNLIAKVLGDYHQFLSSVDTGAWDPGWSSGRSTANSSKTGLHAAAKFSTTIEATPSSAGFVLRLIQASPLWGQSALKADGPVSLLLRGIHLVDGNVMMLVPKNSKTDRVICYEPNGNIWAQQVIGKYIRTRLSKFGCDLSDQTKNQTLARKGSFDGSLATIDLKSASDTLSIETVHQLLPLDWACLLDRLRSKVTTIDGVPRRNEKFSSMGNGFTFELESLVFWALCKAVSSFVSVYGDDIIVNSSAFGRCESILERFGFWLNREKSFSCGPFRESCGGDFFLGVRVTPVYLRSLSQGWTVKFHNQLWDRLPDVVLRKDYDRLRRLRIEPFPLGPHGFGDGHYSSNLDEATPKVARHGIEGWWYTSVVQRRPLRIAAKRVTSPVSARKVNVFDLPLGGLVAALAPKRPESLVESYVDARVIRDHKIRALCHRWPERFVV